MNILIVDDEILIRRSLARAIILKGHSCIEAEDGQRGLDLISAQSFDAVILDLIMPVKSGYEFIQESTLVAPIFIISAFSGPELSADYLKSDSRIKMVIKKPFDNLFATVDQILNAIPVAASGRP